MPSTKTSFVVSVVPLRADAHASELLQAQRDSDRLLAHWLQKTQASTARGTRPPFDFLEIEKEEWRHRFLMTVDAGEGSVLLLWGSGLADLLEIPAGRRTHISISRGIPDYYSAVFARACIAVRERFTPIRVEAQIMHADGR